MYGIMDCFPPKLTQINCLHLLLIVNKVQDNVLTYGLIINRNYELTRWKLLN